MCVRAGAAKDAVVTPFPRFGVSLTGIRRMKEEDVTETKRHGQAARQLDRATESALLRALVARYLDPEAARPHVGPPSRKSEAGRFVIAAKRTHCG
jgi:hypothetical protein